MVKVVKLKSILLKNKLIWFSCALLAFSIAFFVMAIPLNVFNFQVEEAGGLGFLGSLIFGLAVSVVGIFLLYPQMHRSGLCVLWSSLSVLLFCTGAAYLTERASLCGTLLMLMLLTFYFGLCALSWRVTRLYKFFEKDEAWASCTIALSLCLIIVGLFNRENFIYYWDSAGHWKMALEAGDYICNNPIGCLKYFYTSVCTEEHPQWIPLLLGLPLKLMGRTHTAYIVVLVLLFLMPTAATYAAITQKVMLQEGNKRIPTHYLFFFYAFSGALLLPTLNGYADAACVLLIAVLTGLAIHTDLTRFQPLELTLMGLTISHLALMRRSYDFWIITYAFACVVLTLLVLQKKEGKERIDGLKGGIANLLVIGCIGIVVLISFFGYFKSALNFNAAWAYQAWTATANRDMWGDILQNYGLILLISALGGVFFAGKELTSRKRAAKVCGICIILLIVQSSSTAGFALHSYYWITGQLLLLAGIGIYGLYQGLEERLGKCILAGMLLFTCVGFLHSTHILPANRAIGYLIPAKYYEFKKSSTVDDVIDVLTQIRQLPEEYPLIYVLGTDSTFNDDILRNAYLPDTFDSAYIYATAHADFRDGFYPSLLDADYVLTISPTEYHLAEEYQRVVAIPNKLIMNDSTALGQCYEEIASIPFEGRVVSIQKKIRPIDLASVRELEDAFNAVYPEYPELFYNRLEDYAVANGLI